MKMLLTYVHLQRRDVVPVNLDLDPCIAVVDDKAAETVAEWVPRRHVVPHHPFDWVRWWVV